MKTSTLALLGLMLATGTTVAKADDTDAPKFKFTPSGRILMDAAVYGPNHDGFSNGVGIPDVRLGGKAEYGKWSAKIDIGYAYGKVSMKDVFIQYTFNESNYIKGGYFVPQFGLQSSTSSSFKPYMEAPITDSFMHATDRDMAVTYVLDKPDVLMAATVMTDASLMKESPNTQGKISAGIINRNLWRPLHETGNIAQVGLSWWYQTPRHIMMTAPDGHQYAGPGYLDYGVNFPSRVCKVPLMGANITDAKGVFKISPEVLVAKGRVALEGQYYWMDANRGGGFKHYAAQGVYGYFRGLILGDGYGYAHADGGLATPKPGSLEVVAGYNYTDGNSNGLNAGKVNDYSVTFNYYINKYMLCRLRYSYTDVHDSDVQHNRGVNIIQARLQIKF